MTSTGSWTTLAGHRAWLDGEGDRLLSFAEAAATGPAPGFAWLDDDGRPDPAQPPQLWITARMTYVFALATLRGLRRQRARFPVVGMYLGGLVVAAGIAGILQPTWPSVLFAALASPVTVALIRLTGRRLVPAALLPCRTSGSAPARRRAGCHRP